MTLITAAGYLGKFGNVKRREGPELLLHSMLIGAALAVLAIGVASKRPRAGRYGVVVALLFIALVAWSAQGAMAASKAAAAIAGGQPFCVQVQGRDNGYRPAVGLVELSRLSMRARHFAYFHGVAVVGAGADRKLYNWSHWRSRWDALPEGMQEATAVTIRCVPRKDFAKRLAWWPDYRRASQPRGVYAHLQGRSFLIQTDFHARASGNYVSFHSRGTGFQPVSTAEIDSDRLQYSNSLEFRPRDWMDGLLDIGYPENPLDVDPRSNAVQRGRFGGTLHVGRNAAGVLHTVVICGPGNARYAGSCQHRFYADGAMWTFRHPLAELVRWRTLQTAFRDRVMRFEAAAARCEAGPC